MRLVVKLAAAFAVAGFMLACRGPSFETGEGASSTGAGPTGGAPQGGGPSGGAPSGGAPTGGGGAGGADPCAACVAGDNATAVCEEGACTYTCDAGFGDCDSEPSDCEVDVKVDGQCGACGVVCGYGECIALDAQYVCNDPIDIEAGSGFSCALKRDGSIWCWGENAAGFLGRETPGDTGPLPAPVTFVGETIRAAYFGLGSNYGCAIATDGAMACWPHLPLKTGKAIIVEETSISSFALSLRGLDALAIVGPPGPTSQIKRFNFDGSSSVNLTNELSGGALSVDTVGATAVDCIVNDDGELFCKGPNVQGQNGPGSGVLTSYTLTTSSPLAFVGVGTGHTCVLTQAGAALCRGRNTVGAFLDTNVANGNLTVVAPANVDRLVVGPSHNAVFISQTLFFFGENSDDRCRPGGGDVLSPEPRDFGEWTPIDVALGEAHTCVLFDTGRVQCWGRGTSGQLGNGGTTSSSDPVDVVL